MADTDFSYRNPNDIVLVGDWNGDHTDTLVVRRADQHFVKNGVTIGVADATFIYGNRSDTVLVRHWSARQTGDSLGVRPGDVYCRRDSLTSGVADTVFAYGHRDDISVVASGTATAPTLLVSAVRQGRTGWAT